jgi:glycosyltransferase involved in cell wall biosynthesis
MKNIIMGENNYKVTIAVPVYGVESYVEKCVESLFEQTYSNIEFMFINDCTPDKSIEIIESVLERYPSRKGQVRIINQSVNKGCPAARNLAIQLATGEFIFQVDSDDYIEKDAISTLVIEQKATDADLVAANYVIETPNETRLVRYCDISKSKEEIVKDCLDDKSSQSVVSILVKRQIYTDNNIRANESFHVGEDWQVAPLLLYHAKKIAYVDKVIYHYQLSRPNSITITSQTSITKKKNQLICFVKTMNCLLESFKDKGQTYLDVIYRKKAILVQDAMIYCCKDRDRKSFNDMLCELKSIDFHYLSVLGNANPIVSVLKRNYYSMLFLLWLKENCHR